MGDKKPLVNPFRRKDLHSKDFGFWKVVGGVYAAIACVLALLTFGQIGPVAGIIGGYVASILLAHRRDNALWILISFVTTTGVFIASIYITDLATP